MRLNGTLENYLKEINQQAAEMLESLIRQYAKAEGFTEALKRSDQLSEPSTSLKKVCLCNGSC